VIMPPEPRGFMPACDLARVMLQFADGAAHPEAATRY
jgi:hypothetical protein